MSYIEIDTTAGRVRGAIQGTVTSFLGVPYGADTATRRFQAPLPPTPWDGVRDALEFGPACPQVTFIDEGDAAALKWLEHPRGGTPLEGGSSSEDCLRLNVWKPTNSADPLPVLVWLHGGGFFAGSGNEAWFNGDILAPTENLIVVTVTHRLGIFGFLNLTASDYGEARPDAANAGMLDLVLALEWVRDNITAFGGDPTKVTIAGHSGGSGKVSALIGMPAARGLFRRAIMQSGPVSVFPTPDESCETSRRVLHALGDPSLDELETMEVERLLAAQGAALEGVDGTTLLSMNSIPGFAPSLDSRHLSSQPFESAVLPDLELLIGSTTHELGSLLAGTPIYGTHIEREHAVQMLDHFAPGLGESQFETASTHGPNDPPHLVFVRALVENGFDLQTRKITEAVSTAGGRVWQYLFDQPTEMLRGLLGACHGLEIPYVFGTIARSPLTGFAAGRQELAHEMMQAWGSFARTGAPASSGAWPEWSHVQPYVHRFAASITSGADRSTPAATVVASRSTYDSARTPLAALLRDPAALAVIDEIAPQLPKHPMIGLAKALPLDKVIELSGEALTPDAADQMRRRIEALTPGASSKPQRRWRWARTREVE
jgi:para-nitrobenzyl esterase